MHRGNFFISGFLRRILATPALLDRLTTIMPVAHLTGTRDQCTFALQMSDESRGRVVKKPVHHGDANNWNGTCNAIHEGVLLLSCMEHL
jgi:hypothetical protein